MLKPWRVAVPALVPELDDVVAVLVVGTRVTRTRKQVFHLVDARAANIGASSLSAPVNGAEGAAAHKRADLAGNHGHADHCMGAAALDGLPHMAVDEIIRLVPGNLLPTGILVEALLGIGALHGLGDTVGIVQHHNARGALAADMPVANGAFGVARQLDNHAIDNMGFDGAVVKAHVAGRGNPLPCLRIIGRLLRRGARQIGPLLLCRAGRASRQPGPESRSASPRHEPAGG